MRTLVGSLLLFLAWQPSLSQDRPNILLLVAEDLSPRIGSYGDSVANTPHLDELARQGVRYTSVFTTAGVCAPSRAALITGMHQISIGAQHMRSVNEGYFAVPPENVKAFPELLRAAGYYTFTDGKIDYQFSERVAGTGPFTIWDEEGEGTDWRQREAGQPFFGLINFLDTHESRLRRQWREDGNPQAELVTNPSEVQVPPYYPDIPEVRIDLARHYDNIHLMDQRVGELLATLEADGLADSTIVIWTTDHGDALPRAKREVYDSGIHVPMLARFPEQYAPEGWEPGASRSQLVSFVDFAPTILALAGVPTPRYLHGTNFLTEERTFVYASRDRIDEVSDRQRAVRNGQFKYIRSWFPNVPGGHELAYRDNIDMVAAMRVLYMEGQLNQAQARWYEAPGREQLYDLISDPFELNNLVDSPEYADTKNRLSEELDRWLLDVSDWSNEAEDEMRRRFLGPTGEIRETAPPEIDARPDGIYISARNGASVGYRIDQGPWQLYSMPLRNVTGMIEAQAVRYGWRVSSIQSLQLE